MQERQADVPQCIYAVGDIHGCDKLLAELLERIEADLNDDPPAGATCLVFLGDYIDRGEHSRQVVDRLLTINRQVVFLKGNHEAALLAFLQDAGAGPQWLEFGGAPTLASYGVSCPRLRRDDAGWEKTRADLIKAMPATHRRFFQNLRLYVYFAPYLFVHAGINPSKPFAQQTERDFLWIREPFLHDARSLPFRVVHGHTPVPHGPYVDHRRIGIDTCAYATGSLTAARLQGDDISFINTG